MHSTFNIENMQTYFRDYVPCAEHPRQPITNFCTQKICLKFMCPECVEKHSRTHANHHIQSIKTCIRRTSKKLCHTVEQLEKQMQKHSITKMKSTEDYKNQLIKQLQSVRASLINDINTYFRDKQQQIKRQTSKSHEIKIKITQLRSEMVKVIEELGLLDANLCNHSKCVNAIKKANKIDYFMLLQHFQGKIHQIQAQMSNDIRVQMSESKRQQFKTVLNSLIGIKNRNPYQNKGHAETHGQANIAINNMSRRIFNNVDPKVQQMVANLSDRVEHMVNPSGLSADRIMNQAAFRIDQANYFEKDPFLHFFEISKSNLHLIRIKQIKENQPLKWSIIPLNIDFLIPAFHKTVATENGMIYLLGGTKSQRNFQKSNIIYQFDNLHNTLREVGTMIYGRSSHSLLCLQKILYIVGGMSQNEEIQKKCEVFNTRNNQVKQISSCKYPTTNSTLCSLGRDNLIKLGGVDAYGKNSDFIEIYNIAADFWGQVDPTIQNVRGEFGLLSCSGWAPLNDEQIFIFGGYNEQAQNQNSKMSFIFEKNKEYKQLYIRYIGAKNLPLAEGFWSPQSVVHDGKVYALQNVDAELENDCLQDKRNVLIFNGKYWTVCYPE